MESAGLDRAWIRNIGKAYGAGGLSVAIRAAGSMSTRLGPAGTHFKVSTLRQILTVLRLSPEFVRIYPGIVVDIPQAVSPCERAC